MSWVNIRVSEVRFYLLTLVDPEWLKYERNEPQQPMVRTKL